MGVGGDLVNCTTPTRPGCAGPPLPFEHSSHGLLGSNRATGATCRLTPSPAKPLKGEGRCRLRAWERRGCRAFRACGRPLTRPLGTLSHKGRGRWSRGICGTIVPDAPGPSLPLEEPGVRPHPRSRHPRTCSEDPGDPSRNRAARGHDCDFDGPGPAHARPLTIPPAAPLGVAGLDQAEPLALKRAGRLRRTPLTPLPVGAR